MLFRFKIIVQYIMLLQHLSHITMQYNLLSFCNDIIIFVYVI